MKTENNDWLKATGLVRRVNLDQVSSTTPGTSSTKTLLNRVSLRIDRGDAIGLIGASGSGKSTLLRSIVKLDPLEAGQVFYQGQVIDEDQLVPFRRQVVYLAQRPTMIPGTVFDNLALPFQFGASKSSLTREQANATLDRCGRSPDLLDQDAATLSGGEQQWVALLRAILVAPSILLLDEPTASLDPQSTTEFERLAKHWKNEVPERAWIWTSHDHQQVARMSDRQLVMHEGKISAGKTIDG